MSMTSHVELSDWNRKEIYDYYKSYDDPFFSICTQLDVTQFVKFTKARRYPFSLCLVYLSLHQANLHDSFRFRIINDEVVLMNTINAAMTVLHANDCFDYCFFQYHQEFFEFLSSASGQLENHRKSQKCFHPIDKEYDILHYTMLPWINFSNMRHAHDYKRIDSIPKFVFGKYTEVHGRSLMPMSIEVNHALMDAIHVARYINDLQEVLSKPEVAMMMMAPVCEKSVAHA